MSHNAGNMVSTLLLFIFFACSQETETPEPEIPDKDNTFYFGADLSYVNQILDHDGVYKENNTTQDPYAIFNDRGTDLVRLRLWHNPVWTKDVYGASGTQLYNDLPDVEKAIRRSKELGMKILLDFHYSDRWADPGSQEIPAAWIDIKEIGVLEDSVYNYTFKTLSYLNELDLMPEFVQIGNETNCGMMYEFNDNPVDGFPSCNGCQGKWGNLRKVINSAISAIRSVSAASTTETKILLHIADPVHVEFFIDNVIQGGTVSDFDMIGFSYYPLWHTGVPLSQLSNKVSDFKSKYGKDIMILETAYPWTLDNNDSYNNIFGAQSPVTGFPFSVDGQQAIMEEIVQEMIDGGGIGIVYWEPAWITSSAKDLWGTGSSWENCALFDFEGNASSGFDFMESQYTFK